MMLAFWISWWIILLFCKRWTKILQKNKIGQMPLKNGYATAMKRTSLSWTEMFRSAGLASMGCWTKIELYTWKWQYCFPIFRDTGLGRLPFMSWCAAWNKGKSERLFCIRIVTTVLLKLVIKNADSKLPILWLKQCQMEGLSRDTEWKHTYSFNLQPRIYRCAMRISQSTNNDCEARQKSKRRKQRALCWRIPADLSSIFKVELKSQYKAGRPIGCPAWLSVFTYLPPSQLMPR